MLFIQTKIPKISVRNQTSLKWNGSFRFGPTGIFGTTFKYGPIWSVQLGSFPFAKSLYLVPLFCILLTSTITKRAVPWIGSWPTVPFGEPEISEIWRNRNFLLNRKRLWLIISTGEGPVGDTIFKSSWKLGDTLFYEGVGGVQLLLLRFHPMKTLNWNTITNLKCSWKTFSNRVLRVETSCG